jgi:hypothetical protein
VDNNAPIHEVQNNESEFSDMSICGLYLSELTVGCLMHYRPIVFYGNMTGTSVGGVSVAQFIVVYVVFCRPLFVVVLLLGLCSLPCMPIYDLRLLFLVPSNHYIIRWFVNSVHTTKFP